MDWTKKAVATLRRMAADGKSFREVAEVLGTTRCTVAGKANRLGVKFTGRRGALSFPTPEEMSARSRRLWASLSPEERSARNRAPWAKLTPEQKSDRVARSIAKTPNHIKHAERKATNG